MPPKGTFHSAETIERMRLVKLGKTSKLKGRVNGRAGIPTGRKGIPNLKNRDNPGFWTGKKRGPSPLLGRPSVWKGIPNKKKTIEISLKDTLNHPVFMKSNTMIYFKQHFFVLICPICKTTFAKDINLTLFYQLRREPLCCSTRCNHTLRNTLQPEAQYIQLESKIVSHQILYRVSQYIESSLDKQTQRIEKSTVCWIDEYGSREIFEFDLQQEIGRSVQYGDYNHASEKEQIQQAKDICDLQTRTQDRIKEVRHMLSRGFNKSEIARYVKRSQSNIAQFVDRYNDYIYPL